MKIEEVKEKVKELKVLAGNPEVAHQKEDELYIAVLRSIASGSRSVRTLAKEALEARKIDFPRWYE